MSLILQNWVFDMTQIITYIKAGVTKKVLRKVEVTKVEFVSYGILFGSNLMLINARNRFLDNFKLF